MFHPLTRRAWTYNLETNQISVDLPLVDLTTEQTYDTQPNYVRALVFPDGTKWDQSATRQIGEGAIIPYSFAMSLSGYASEYNSGFLAFNDAQKNAVRNAFASISAVANLTFIEVPDSQPSVIRFANIDYLIPESPNAAAFVHDYPAGSIAEELAAGGTLSADVFLLRKYWSDFENPIPGRFGAYAIIHEIGHALGLRHSFETDLLPNTQRNSYRHSVMAYTSVGAYVPATPMLFDIAALQYLYGANTTTGAGDTTYRWLSPKPLQTIWDVGGTDTIDASNVVAYHTIRLNQGSFSSIGTLVEFSIAYGTVIENAIGGVWSDWLIGNPADNTLSGLAGDDIIQGLAGNDVLIGGTGNDVLSGGTGNDLLDGGEGIDTADYADLTTALTANLSTAGSKVTLGPSDIDTLLSVEILRGGGANDVMLGGNTSAITMFGFGGDDVLITGQGGGTAFGGSGNDLVVGQGDDAWLSGGAGNDRILGSGKRDTVDYSYSTVGVRLNLYNGAQSTVTVSEADIDIVSQVDNAVGSAFNDVLLAYGTSGTLWGGDGNDQLVVGYTGGRAFGGDGNDLVAGQNSSDILSGGPGNDLILGGGGNDLVDYGYATVGVTVAISAGASARVTVGASDIDVINSVEGAIGGSGDDLLIGDGGANELRGGAGNDVLIGGAGNDLYRFARGDGSDRIENAASDGATAIDTLELGAGIGADDLVFSRAGNDLLLALGGADSIRFVGWYAASANRIDVIRLSSGSVITPPVLTLLQTMSLFEPAPSAPTSARVPIELDPVCPIALEPETR
jgi:Ca2+-binding RTX toxin-like protein